MLKRLISYVVCLAQLGPLAVRAGDALDYGPAPKWVAPQVVPVAPTGSYNAGVRLLLSDLQLNIAPKVMESYVDSVVQIQSPQDLAVAGNITLSWRPETDRLTVHKLAILRGDKEIDVLRSGQTFTILRREDMLEHAVLSGVLTAFIQPDGLRVGDRIELSYTLKREDSLLGGVPEQILLIQPGAAIGRVHLRTRWPADYKMSWRASTYLDGLNESRSDDTVELSTTRDFEEPLVQPAGAPARFAALRLLQVTGHRSWSEVSKLLFPLFDRASRLSSASPLKAEVARIRSLTPDLGGRAQLALRLVQDQIRYVYIGMNDARIVPADVDTTWSRRYGDCKAKTVLLLALLHELGVQAEPVAVSTIAGDALPSRLPMIGMFNHVLTRATIAGQTYWLDGSRSGDRRLADLVTPNYYWALPLTITGSELIKMETVPMSIPAMETNITVDASAGLVLPASFWGETDLRYDMGTALQQALSGLTSGQRESALRSFWTKQDYWSNNWNEVSLKAVKAEYDDATGVMRLSMNGMGTMNWQGDQHLLGSLSIGDVVNYKREPGPNRDAPYLTNFPTFVRVTERIKLPRDGIGFISVGEDVDRIIAGVHYQRWAKIENGELSAEASVRSVASEFPAPEAPAAQKALHELWDDPLYTRIPAGRKENADDGCVATDNGPAADQNSLTAKDVSPVPGALVYNVSTVSASLDYSIKDYVPGDYFVAADFQTLLDNSINANVLNNNFPSICGPRGIVRITIPLNDVWSTLDLKQPLEITFELIKGGTASQTSVVTARSKPISYEVH